MSTRRVPHVDADRGVEDDSDGDGQHPKKVRDEYKYEYAPIVYCYCYCSYTMYQVRDVQQLLAVDLQQQQ